MAIAPPPAPPKRFKPKFHLRVLGTASPVFPGFEVDILDRVPDDEKPEAVWHRERARSILRSHPEVKSLFGHTPMTALFCLLVAGSQVALAMVSAHIAWWAVIALAWAFGACSMSACFSLPMNAITT